MIRSISIIFLLVSGNIFAQGNNWLQASGSPNVDENLAITKDIGNNLITAGYFTNTITFPNNTSLTSTSAGISDVLLYKTDYQGQILWKVKAGGMGSDRATAVVSDGSGNIYITGHYYGSATFGGITLNSVNSTQDVFIAKLNSSGTFLWAKSIGGNLSEEAYGIDVDLQGNVIVTGEFQGTAFFGSQTLTSMLNSSGNSSFDVFIVKFDNLGNFQWVRQGAAKFDDRGLDVGTDANGNVFVCGQFSDTIAFNVVHNNQIMNAIFLIKYSPSGQEQWFVRAGASSSIAYGLTVDNNNDIYITGDYTGNLVFYGSPNNFLYGNYTNRVFLVKYNNSGGYVWGREDASNSYVSSKDVALNPNEEPCIYGEFDCRMDEYSALAGGTGLFNSVGYHDLFVTQYDKNGNRLWTRNFGGPRNEKAHGITFTNNSSPYLAGSFEYKMFVNVSSTFNLFNSMPPLYESWVSSQNCSTNFQSLYHGTQARGFSDCFIMHGLDNTCQYYDYYYRDGIGCQLDFVGGCIDDFSYICNDTIKICEGSVTANPYTGSIGGVGPLYHYLWNSSDTNSSHLVTSSGYVSCIMTTYDGCFKTEDTVYVKKNPRPQPPTITDNFGINVNQPPLTYSIHVCAGTATLTGGNIQGCSYVWSSYSGSGIVSTSGTSCVVNKTDTFYFTLTNSFGCKAINKVYVKLDTIYHVFPKTNMPDTFRVCMGDCINYFIYDSITNPLAMPYSCFQSLVSVNTNNGQVSGFPYCTPNNLSLRICPVSTGWINLNIRYIFNSLCGRDTAYFNRPVYFVVNPKPTVSIVFSGNNFICPGDSTLLVATFTVQPSTNITFTTTSNDSIWANHAGTYSFGVYAVDTLTGCFGNGVGMINVQTKANPYVYTIPGNGLICPGDSVQLVCTWPGAVSWQWHGPSGIITGNSPMIYDSVPGFYYCVATDNNGCTLQSNTVEIKKYNTPYLIGMPSTVACAGQTVTIQVMSNDTTLIQWLPPFTGGGTFRHITSSGTYSCQVTMCGITTLCTISVIISQPTAQISALGSLTICPGDSVLLTANAGMSSYLWLPTNQSNDSIYAYSSGNYILLITDGNGCQASDTIVVRYDPQAPIPPTTTNDSICAGSVAVLQLTGTNSYPVNWYLQQYSGSVISTSASYTTPILYQNTTYYVSVVNSTGCHSIRVPANVYIYPSSIAPVVWGDSVLCGGDTLHLYTNYIGGAGYAWAGPGNFSSSQLNPIIYPVLSSSAGTYSLAIFGSGCTSPVSTLDVSVISLLTPSILASDSICEGGSLTIQANSSDTGVTYSWSGPGFFYVNSNTLTINRATIGNTGSYIVNTNLGTCKSLPDSFDLFVKPKPAPQISAISGYCYGDSVNLSANSILGSVSSWTGPHGFSSSQSSVLLYPLDSSKVGYYYYVSNLNGCIGKDSLLIQANPLPVFDLGNDTVICNETPWSINPGVNGTYTWNGELNDSVFVVHNSGQIALTVTNQFGCKYSDTLNVTVAQCILETPNIFSPNNDGINDIFCFKIDHFRQLQFSIFDRWGVKVYENANNLNSWDGTNFNSGKPVAEGTYFYIVKYENMRGSGSVLRGYIQLVR